MPLRRRSAPPAPVRLACLVVITTLLASPAAGRGSSAVELVWYWERGDDATRSRDPDRSINPASVVKLATTLWALETLGPQRRFRTSFAIRGEIDPAAGVLHGDLVVLGDGDPDFHVENAQLVAQRLAEHGIRRIAGTLYVDAAFWIGWEGGADKEIRDPGRRALRMAKRLARAWNPASWNDATLRAMRAQRTRSGSRAPFVRIEVSKPAGLASADRTPARPLVEHVSNPLAVTLKRFNDYSNNDIERLAHHLGDAAAMTRFFRTRWRDARPAVRFETLSGLGSNRMSPRQVVRLLRELRASGERHGLAARELLPALDCGRNTLENYPRLLAGLPSGSLVAKTGTLVRTDHGVIVLAGWLATDAGEVAFCVAAPRNGARLRAARNAQSRWLLEQAAQWGAIAGAACGPTELYSYTDASVIDARRGEPG